MSSIKIRTKNIITNMTKGLLTELERGLGSILRRQDPSNYTVSKHH